MTASVLLLDNRDSFVFNLADEFLTLGATVRTVRSGLQPGVLHALLAEFRPDLVVLSPGPGRPDERGNVMVPWLRTRPAVPVLGVCLGHQAMVVAAGGEVGPAPHPVHGRASDIDADGTDPLFKGLQSPFPAARYHSLAAIVLPDALKVVATAGEGSERVIMAIRHRTLPWIGFQFHPESILTPRGSTLVARVLDEALARTARTCS